MDTQTGFALFNAIATAGKTLYDIAQGTSKLETKKQLMDVHDTLMSLKHEAADLEDSNRDLKERLEERRVRVQKSLLLREEVPRPPPVCEVLCGKPARVPDGRTLQISRGISSLPRVRQRCSNRTGSFLRLLWWFWWPE
jgi:hypothetical protein